MGRSMPCVLIGCGLLLGCADETSKRAAVPDRHQRDADSIAEAISRGDVPLLTQTSNAFAFDLFAKLRPREGNLLVGPAGLCTGLSIVYAGARGETAEQIGKVLHIGLNPDRFVSGMGLLARGWRQEASDEGGELRMRLAVWLQSGFPLRPAFQSTLDSGFKAESRSLDFKTAPDQALRTINEWVAAASRGKVQGLLGPETLDAQTRLVLTNVTFFHGVWDEPFLSEFTADRPFSLDGGRRIEVPTMTQVDHFAYASRDGVQILELRYRGLAQSMIVLLPARPDGLAALESALTAERLADWLSSLRQEQVAVSLPRFHLSTRLELGPLLEELGMPLAFGSRADFSGMAGEPGALSISAVVHQSDLAVDEQGTVAASATATAFKTEESSNRPMVFRADHPFLFLVRDNRTGTILFLGRVADPRG